jgi:ubiquinone/menaquinone biosynthesis C-methylase UbiE
MEDQVVGHHHHHVARHLTDPGEPISSERTHGSIEDFEGDWVDALVAGNARWFVYPDVRRDDQVSLMEWVKAREILSLLRAHGIRAGRVLEYGCGSAGISIFLKDYGFETYAIDVSVNALKVARINDEQHRSVQESLHVAAANALSLPMGDSTFDVVMSYGLLEHFDENAATELLAEVTRVLKPGGVFVADIIPARWNARAVGTAVSFAASCAYHLARGEWSTARGLHRRYFESCYETSFGPDVWQRLLKEQGLNEVQVQVCRLFPPLALPEALERHYVRLMRRCLPLWLRFDRSDDRISRAWGWMYLASGRKLPSTHVSDASHAARANEVRGGRDAEGVASIA